MYLPRIKVLLLIFHHMFIPSLKLDWNLLVVHCHQSKFFKSHVKNNTTSLYNKGIPRLFGFTSEPLLFRNPNFSDLAGGEKESQCCPVPVGSSNWRDVWKKLRMLRSTLEGTTPPKTNMFSENWWLEDLFPIEIVPFKGDMLVFRGVRYPTLGKVENHRT